MSSIVRPARRRAWLLASTGPRPMISGERPETPVETMRASGVRPSSRALVSLMTTTAAAPSLRGQQLPAVTRPSGRKTGLRPREPPPVGPGRGPWDLGAVGAEDRLEALDALHGDAGAGTVVLGDDRAVGQRDRSDLALPEAVLDGFLGEVLRADAELVHVLAGDALHPGEVLGGLAHRDVRVGDEAVLARVVPSGALLLGDLGGAGLGLGEERVVCVREAVGVALREAGHHLHARRDEDVALAGLDGVQGHPAGLQRGGAVPGDRAAGKVVHAHLHGDDTAEVVALLAAGQTAPEHQVVDVARVQLRDLGERGLDDRGGEVVRAQVLEGALEGAADGGAGG